MINDKLKDTNKTLEGRVIVSSLETNIATISKLFKDVDILRIKQIENNHNKRLKYSLVFCDGVVDSAIINDNIIKPLMLSSVPVSGSGMIDTVMNQIVQINEAEKTDNLKDIIDAISYGDTVLFADGAAQALILNTKDFKTRPISEPENEKNISGPREGFAESLLANLSMIRRRVRTSELKMKYYKLGRRTQTQACICYMESLADKQILKELYRRLDKIDIDAVLDTNYITELIRDAKLSPFRTVGYTERPDTVIGKLMEGRIAIFLDGTPDVITLPYLFIENFQSSEDYYLSFYYTSFSRMLRIIGFVLTVIVPGLYIAIVAFHHEMMPTQLLINISAERQSVPLPAALEAFLMLLVFDIIRETGVRMPSNIGQTLGILGALVIGQAAVEARLVAAPMIVVAGLTGITSLLVPKLNAPVIYLRFFLLFLSASFGFFGLVLGMSSILIHVINLRSLGTPQVSLTGKLRYQENKDTFIRSPWPKMILRPNLTEDQVRMDNDEGGHD